MIISYVLLRIVGFVHPGFFPVFNSLKLGSWFSLNVMKFSHCTVFGRMKFINWFDALCMSIPIYLLKEYVIKKQKTKQTKKKSHLVDDAAINIWLPKGIFDNVVEWLR